MSRRLDIPEGVITIGNAVVLQIPVVDGNGAPVNISALTLDWQLRATPTSATFLIEKHSPTITVSSGYGGTNNVANIPIVVLDTFDSGGPTILVAAGDYHHALRDKVNDIVIAWGKCPVIAVAGRG